MPKEKIIPKETEKNNNKRCTRYCSNDNSSVSLALIARGHASYLCLAWRGERKKGPDPARTHEWMERLCSQASVVPAPVPEQSPRPALFSETPVHGAP